MGSYVRRLLNAPGDVFGRLTIVELGEPYGPTNKRRWICQCECGNRVLTYASNLRQGTATSCGCLRTENSLKSKTTHGQAATQRQSGAYNSWQAMKQRCLNPNSPAYHQYGARGTTICDRWLQFKNFYADMGDRPEGKSLDRIDGTKGYSPDNCRWATQKEQCRNQRTNRHYEMDGETLTAAEWCERYGASRSLLDSRLAAGWTMIEALTAPPNVNAPRADRPRDFRYVKEDRVNIEKWANGIVGRNVIKRRRHHKELDLNSQTPLFS